MAAVGSTHCSVCPVSVRVWQCHTTDRSSAVSEPLVRPWCCWCAVSLVEGTLENNVLLNQIDFYLILALSETELVNKVSIMRPVSKMFTPMDRAQWAVLVLNSFLRSCRCPCAEQGWVSSSNDPITLWFHGELLESHSQAACRWAVCAASDNPGNCPLILTYEIPDIPVMVLSWHTNWAEARLCRIEEAFPHFWRNSDGSSKCNLHQDRNHSLQKWQMWSASFTWGHWFRCVPWHRTAELRGWNPAHSLLIIENNRFYLGLC